MSLLEFFSDYTLRTVMLGSLVLGVVSGSLGSFAVLRRQALLGDAISHAALPGIVLAYLLTMRKTPLLLLLGAAIAGWLATLLVMSVIRNSRIKSDAALGLMLSVFFGFGMVLLTFIQRMPQASQAGLDTFLFGQAATLLQGDVLVMTALGLPALVLLGLFWKEFKLLSFDPEFAAAEGLPTRRLDMLLTGLLVIAIVIGLQTVGVVLMSAMVVAPAAAARQWTDRLSLMVVLAALFGATAGVSGSVISSLATKLPTGPTIVIVLSLLVLVSLYLAPARGLLWRWLRRRHQRGQLRVQAVLNGLRLLAMQHEDYRYAHEESQLQALLGQFGGVRGTLKELEERGWVARSDDRFWSLTDTGFKEAQRQAEGGEEGSP